jgi:hypothetical protein
VADVIAHILHLLKPRLLYDKELAKWIGLRKDCGERLITSGTCGTNPCCQVGETCWHLTTNPRRQDGTDDKGDIFHELA